MSFGYSVGDFIAVGVLAWDVYKSCKGAPESFGNISSEVLSLHAVLKEAEETVFARHLSLQKRERLKAVGDGCYRVLEDLQTLVKKYESLGTQSKRTWDRLKWGTEDIAELRSRLTSNGVLLTACITMSQASVERKLDAFLREFREGRREGSIISTQTVESLCADDKQVWRTIRKELEDIGVTVAAFNNNKDFIINWVSNAVASGAFEEQRFDTNSIAGPREKFSVDQLTADVGGIPSQESSVKARQGGMSSSKDAVGNSLPFPSPKNVAAQRPRIPLVAALIAGLSRPRKSLISAAKEGNLLNVSRILNDQTKLDLIDSESLDQAMYQAADQMHTQVVRLLLEKGADVSVPDKEGYTVLQRTSRCGHEHLVRLLLEKGVDVNIAGGRERRTALQHASMCGHGKIVRLLLEKGADINVRDEEGCTALQLASMHEHESVVRLLLEKGADVNIRDKDGWTALQLASMCGHEQIVRLLLEKGADVNVAGGQQPFTALQHASKYGHEEVVRLLLEKGADINIRDEEGCTALQLASMCGHEQIVQLFEKGADLNITDKDIDAV